MTGPDTGGPPSGPRTTPHATGAPQADAGLVAEIAAWVENGRPVQDGTEAVPLTSGQRDLLTLALATRGTGRVVTALTAEQRADNYRRQTGRPVTARQRRRIAHKANRAGRLASV